MEQRSYFQILRSSVLVGGASVIGLALGAARGKVLAITMGPAGVGIFGALSSILALASAVAGMGIGNSGVQAIAQECARSEDRAAISAYVVRRLSRLLGIAGACVLLLGSVPLARLTFGDGTRALDIALLSLGVLLTVISAGEIAVIQGYQRVDRLASANVVGAVTASLMAIIPLLLNGRLAVAWFLVAVAGGTAAGSWFYSRSFGGVRAKVDRTAFHEAAKSMMHLGVAFMGSALLCCVVGYATRVLIIHTLGLQSAGAFQAAWALSGVYVGFVLNAMTADYFPRLSAVADQRDAANRMINEQTESALLIATPGIAATMVFASLVIRVFYTAEFSQAVSVLQWQSFGVFFRVLSWPMAYILLARRLAKPFLILEVATNVAHITLVYVFVRNFGLRGAGMSFAALYVMYTVALVTISHRVSRFRWSRQVLSSIVVCVVLTILAFLAGTMASLHRAAMWAGIIIIIASCWYSLATISSRMGGNLFLILRNRVLRKGSS